MTEKLSFTVLSSDKISTYQIEAFETPTGFRFTCTCVGAQNGRACRHRSELFDGETKGLVSKNFADVKKLRTMLEHSPLSKEMSELRSLEKNLDAVKRAINDQKNRIVRLMGG